jgi:G3E family GTPase
MKTTLVCGLLGSGKTTFIRTVLQNSGQRTVVLVNDFGSAGIDGDIVRADGIEAVELPSGCVCCSLKFDLITTIERLVKSFAPGRLVIEPSGVASASGVLEALESVDVGPVHVVGMVDATEFVALHEEEVYGPFFEDQVVNSDIILVNKTDLAGRKKTTDTVRLVERLNPGALVFPTVRAHLGGGLPDHRGRATAGEAGEHPFRFETLTFRGSGTAGFARMENLFGDMASGTYGGVVRAKALVVTERGPARFELAWGAFEAAPFEGALEESRVVVIGTGLREEALRSAIPL